MSRNVQKQVPVPVLFGREYLSGRSRHFAQVLLSPALAPLQRSLCSQSCSRKRPGVFHGPSFDLYFFFWFQKSQSDKMFTYRITLFFHTYSQDLYIVKKKLTVLESKVMFLTIVIKIDIKMATKNRRVSHNERMHLSK